MVSFLFCQKQLSANSLFQVFFFFWCRPITIIACSTFVLILYLGTFLDALSDVSKCWFMIPFHVVRYASTSGGALSPVICIDVAPVADGVRSPWRPDWPSVPSAPQDRGGGQDWLCKREAEDAQLARTTRESASAAATSGLGGVPGAGPDPAAAATSDGGWGEPVVTHGVQTHTGRETRWRIARGRRRQGVGVLSPGTARLIV